MVSRVVGGTHAGWVLGVGHYFVEIDDCIEVARCANPVVDCLAIGFVSGGGVIVVGAAVGKDRGADDLEVLGVGAGDDLFIAADDAMYEGGVLCFRSVLEAGEAAEIVDSFKDDDGAHAGLGEYVAVKTGEDVWAETVGKEMVSADAVVEHPDVAGGWVGLEVACE